MTCDSTSSQPGPSVIGSISPDSSIDGHGHGVDGGTELLRTCVTFMASAYDSEARASGQQGDEARSR